MDSTKSRLPSRIEKWFSERGISENTIQQFNIHWNGVSVVIPIYDKDGDFLFNKYRRDPDKKDGPKYIYDKGSKQALFNASAIKENEPVFIVEGELDAVLLSSFGLNAVSTTGGSGNFEPSWIPYFETCSDIFICYDYDEAGIKGSFMLQQHLPEAKILWLPQKGYDVTDFFQKGGTLKEFEDIAKTAQSWWIPDDIDTTQFKYKKDINEKITEHRNYVQYLIQVMRDEKKDIKANTFHIEKCIEIHNQIIGELKKCYKRFKKKNTDNVSTGNRIEKAKQVPITKYIHFDRRGFAKSIWNPKERTPSMYYNNFENKFPNTVKCFSTGNMGDVIDVVQKIYNVDFNEAINIILNDL